MKYIPIIAFIFLGIIWGSNFIYMKLASELISPLQVVFLRVLFGFVPVYLYALMLKKIKLSHLKYSFHFFIMSLLGTSLYYYFFVKSTSLLPSAITGAISGSIPIFTFLFSLIFLKDEKTTKTKLLGILLGFFGVILISKPYQSSFDVNLWGIYYVLVGSIFIGTSFVYAKKFIMPLKLHFSALCAYQLGFALLGLFVVVSFDGISNILTNNHVFLGVSIGLGFLGTGIAFIIYYYIIEKLGAIKASSSSYLPPVVALIIGYFIKEDINFIDIFATIIIFAGVFLINKKD